MLETKGSRLSAKLKKIIHRTLHQLGIETSSIYIHNSSPQEVYSGYTEDDFATLRSFADSEANIDTLHYTDGFGVKTLFECVPFVSFQTLNLRLLEFPVPDDGFHAETIEYVALTDALSRSRLDRGFCAVEIGAGWGPWITAAGVIARKNGCKAIKLVGVEASTNRFHLMCRHLEVNDLRPLSTAIIEDVQYGNIFSRLFKGAVWTHDGTVWFPKADITDMGSAASALNEQTDYRGAKTENLQVPCRRLDTLLNDLGVINFMHIDIQGAELELLQNQIEWMSNNVQTLMIATHSRTIEGKLIELLFDRGWQLHREKPCRANWYMNCSITGKTIVDGSQYWLNRNIIKC